MQRQARSLPLVVDLEVELPLARVQLIQLHHRGPRTHNFRREGIYWIDLCLTPRRPNASGRYSDFWAPHRFAELGPLIALPPGAALELKSAGGRHASLICQMREAAVTRWLPKDFEWTDRRLEACLHIASERIRWSLLRLYQELRHPGIASSEMCGAIVEILSIEVAQYIVSVSEPVEKGGLASWRLRLIDIRMAEDRQPPTLTDLAALCRMSVRQLTRGFRTSRGCSINAYLAQVRMDTAKRRLVAGDSIKDITALLGYATQSGFTFAFRRATGITPDQYRKQAGTELPQSHVPPSH